nr:hypothetical protein [uncultured Brevundimonas sp.]
MRILQSILMLLGALSVLMLGAGGASASPREVAPCHQSTHQTSDHAPAPMKAMKAMSCCVACVATAVLQPAAAPDQTISPERLAHPASNLPVGLRPRPEHGPPRFLIA